MTAPKVLVVGDVITDIIAMPEGPIVRGSDRRAIIRQQPGGSGANQAVWLGSFGVDVTFVSRVAAADVARQTASFAAKRVKAILAADPELPSGVLISIVDLDGERSFLTDRGANLNLCSDDVPLTLLDDTDLLLISGYSFFSPRPRSAVVALLRAATQRGIPTAIDPASVGFLREVGPDEFLGWTRGTGTIFANLDEALELTGSIDLNQQMQTLGRIYGRVVIKRGSAGAAIGDQTGLLRTMAAAPRSVVDTTGAGDAFAAAFLARELGGGSLEECLTAGVEAGASAVTKVGAQPV